MASTSQGPGETDRHGWNSLENYRSIHENRLNYHSFLDPDRPHTIAFIFLDIEGDIIVQVAGEIYCLGGIVVEVEKYLETKGYSKGRSPFDGGLGVSPRFNTSPPFQEGRVQGDGRRPFSAVLVGQVSVLVPPRYPRFAPGA